MYGMKYI